MDREECGNLVDGRNIGWRKKYWGILKINERKIYSK